MSKSIKFLNNGKKNQKPHKRPEIRSLKIQPKTRFNRYGQKDVPEIKLCGNWLENLGFAKGQRVTITTMHKLLIIRLDDE